jgi:hypothetical protein
LLAVRFFLLLLARIRVCVCAIYTAPASCQKEVEHIACLSCLFSIFSRSGPVASPLASQTLFSLSVSLLDLLILFSLYPCVRCLSAMNRVPSQSEIDGIVCIFEIIHSFLGRWQLV